MSSLAIRRDLGPQFEASTRARCTKMATAAAAGSQPHASTMDGGSEQRQVLTPAILNYTPLSHGISQQAMTSSPASTESLIGHTVGDQAFSPAGPNRPYYNYFTTPGLHPQDHNFNAADLYDKLSALLERGLATTAAKITGDIKSDLQNIGSRIEVIES